MCVCVCVCVCLCMHSVQVGMGSHFLPFKLQDIRSVCVLEYIANCSCLSVTRGLVFIIYFKACPIFQNDKPFFGLVLHFSLDKSLSELSFFLLMLTDDWLHKWHSSAFLIMSYIYIYLEKGGKGRNTHRQTSWQHQYAPQPSPKGPRKRASINYLCCGGCTVTGLQLSYVFVCDLDILSETHTHWPCL